MDPQAHGQFHTPMARLCRRRVSGGQFRIRPTQPFLLQADIELAQGLDHTQPGSHRPLRVIFVRQRIAEVDDSSGVLASPVQTSTRPSSSVARRWPSMSSVFKSSRYASSSWNYRLRAP
jgi:hypothetical protein